MQSLFKSLVFNEVKDFLLFDLFKYENGSPIGNVWREKLINEES